jgi:hypothetical protein
MLQLGNVGVGETFVYKKGLFVILPFNWELEQYPNLCIATRNREEFEVGKEYFFDEQLKVEIVSALELKNLISKS